MMGFDYNYASAFAEVLDTAQRPEFITHDWYFYSATTDSWVLNVTFKVTCKGK